MSVLKDPVGQCMDTTMKTVLSVSQMGLDRRSRLGAMKAWDPRKERSVGMCVCLES